MWKWATFMCTEKAGKPIYVHSNLKLLNSIFVLIYNQYTV